MTTTMTRYFLAPAPGYYGDKDRVLSSHATVEAARKAARRWNRPESSFRVAIYEGAMRRGETWYRSDEQSYTEVRP